MIEIREALRRLVSIRQAPDEIDITHLRAGMTWLNNKAWDDNVEYWNCIFYKENSIHLVHETRGHTNGVNPQCDVHNDHYGGYKGSIHIHLADKRGHAGFGFSFPDYYWTLKDGDHIALVLSGERVYALYRVRETRKPGDISYEECYECDRMWGQVDKQLKAEKKFNEEMCSRLGYVLYEGKRESGVLKKWTPRRVN